MPTIDVARLNGAARRMMINACDIRGVAEDVEDDGSPYDAEPVLIGSAVPCSMQVIREEREIVSEQESMILTHTVYFADDLSLRQGTRIEVGGQPVLYVQTWYDASAGAGAMWAAGCMQRSSEDAD